MSTDVSARSVDEGGDLPSPEFRSVRAVAELERTMVAKASRGDCFTRAVAAVASRPTFVGLHVVVFTVWVGVNLTSFAFDPYPFGLLTTAVSLEAIVLSLLLLSAQNHMSAQADRSAA